MTLGNITNKSPSKIKEIKLPHNKIQFNFIYQNSKPKINIATPLYIRFIVIDFFFFIYNYF